MFSDAEQVVIAEIDRQLEPIKTERIAIQEKLAELLQAEERLEKARAQFKEKSRGADERTVYEVCTTIAKQNAPLPKADLEALAKEKLKERGFSLTGVHRRLKKCLSAAPFCVDDNQLIALDES